MSKKKILAVIVIILTILCNILIFRYVNVGNVEANIPRIGVEISSDKADVYQIYYANADEAFNDEKMDTIVYGGENKNTKLMCEIDLNCKTLRIDFGSQPSTIRVYNVWYEVGFRKQQINLDLFLNSDYKNDIASVTREENGLSINTSGNDPYIVIDSETVDFYNYIESALKRDSLIVDIILCIVIDLMVAIIIRHFNLFLELPIDFVKNRKLILSLSKNDFKTKFAGSYLGIVWAFIQPVITVAVYWFVFQVGMRVGSVSEFPYILWLMAGLVPWFYFSDALSSGTGSFIEYNYLVKKVVFKISILPVVKLLSAIIVHIFFVTFVMVLCWFYGYTPDLYLLQIPYYILCTLLLTMGLVYITSSVVIFFRDLSQIIGIILQVGIWVTPIMWDASAMLAPKFLKILRINPLYYIVDGFRDALLGKVWFWEKGLWTIYFWILVVALLCIGTVLFKKLKIHFADVL